MFPSRMLSSASSRISSLSSGMTSRPRPVRLVLFDVFDTLCTPRIPIHLQYYEEAIKAGISQTAITPDSVRKAFKPAFKRMNTLYPLYGKRLDPPLEPGEWWMGVIRACMLEAGADEALLDGRGGKDGTDGTDGAEGVMARLGPGLLERFESDVGYRNFPETLESLDALRGMGVKVSVVSNADPRILRTLRSLGILDRLTHPPTLSWDVELSKPDPGIFQAACEAAGEKGGEGVLMVGDELKADYRGALSAGLEGRLIRREGEWSDGAVRTQGEDLSGVRVVKSLEEIVEEVRARNGR